MPGTFLVGRREVKYLQLEQLEGEIRSISKTHVRSYFTLLRHFSFRCLCLVTVVTVVPRLCIPGLSRFSKSMIRLEFVLKLFCYSAMPLLDYQVWIYKDGHFQIHLSSIHLSC